MTVLPALLAGAAVALLVGLPGPAALRVHTVLLDAVDATPPAAGQGSWSPSSWLSGSGGLRSSASGSAASTWAGSRQVAIVLGLAGLAGLVAVVLLLGPGAAVLVGAGVPAGTRWHRLRRTRTARTQERAAAVEACSALALELRAGRSPSEALAVAADLARGPSREALRAAAAAARWGGDVPAALSVDAGAVPDVLRALGACWQVCARAGSGLAAAVERLADGLRARQAHERAVAAALAGPRASAALLALLPLAGVALAAGLGARPGHVLLHTPFGVVCLVAGLALDAAGLWWTGRLVTRASQAAA